MSLASPPDSPSPPWLRNVRRLALATGLFVFLVVLVMVADWWHLQRVDPLNSSALMELMTRHEQAADDVLLREQIRELDLLARQAYFTRQWHLRTGVWLLLSGSVVLLGCLFVLGTNKRGASTMPGCPGTRESAWAAAGRARRGTAIAAGTILLAALLLGWLWPRYGDRRLTKPESALLQSPRTTIDNPFPETGAAPLNPSTPVPTRGTDEPTATGDHWPGFRGHGGIARTATADQPWPQNWNGPAEHGVRWRTELPLPGFNSPVVWGDRVFLSGADNQQRMVLCYATDSGEELWRGILRAEPGRTAPKVTADTGYAAPSVATDGHAVVAIFANGDIACFKVTGEAVWQRNLGLPANHYGHSSSLICWNGMVLVQFDHAKEASVKALSIKDGATVWDTSRAADISWASPILVPSADNMLLVLAATPTVAAYNPLTGKELWSTDCLGGEVGPSPAYHDGSVFAAQQYASVAALDVETGKIRWQRDDLELPDAASPVATGGLLFLASSHGTVTCLNAATGETLWEHDFPKGGYGSPIVVNNDKIYWMTMNGTTEIFAATDTFKPLASPVLGENSMCTPAFVAGRIYIRGEKNLYCIE